MAKTELEEAGESTEGMAESTASLREEILALSGVDIMKNANEFKSTYEIMDELADKWEGLSDIAQASITELIAGKHQGNVMSSLMANFDIARDALETSQNSAGSAMAEHAKWSDSLQARLNKLKATWQSLSQTFLKSDFLKGGIYAVTGFVNALDKVIDKTGVIIPLLTAFAGKKIFSRIFDTAKLMKAEGLISSIAEIVPVLTGAFPKLAAVFSAFSSGGIAAGFSAILGLINPITAAITAAAVAIGAVGVMAYKQKKDVAELAEKVGDVTTKYKEQRKEIEKTKGDYDTSKEDSMILKYKELSRGIDQYGENLSLTADEYAEYSDIVNSIADQMPNLVSGYNSQGDAILSCAGNVAQLTEEYKNLIKEQNSEVTDIGSDIFKDYENDLKKTSAYHETYKASAEGWSEEVIENYDTEHIKQLEKLMNTGSEGLEDAVSKLTQAEVSRISGLLEEYGIERDTLGSGEAGWENQREHIIRALGEDRKQVKGILSKASEDLNAYAEDMGTLTSAYLSTAFLGGDSASGIDDYSGLSDKMQSIIGKVTSSLDTDFYSQFLGKENGYELFTQSIDSILSSFKSLDGSESANFEAAFDLKTKFNGGDISFGEYVKGIQKAENIVNGLTDLDPNVASGIKLALNTKEITDNYNAIKNRLTSDEYSIQMKTDDAEKFINSLSSSEYSVAIDLVRNGNMDFDDIESLREFIENEAKFNEAMRFTIAIDVEAESIAALNTALGESVSATGLSAEAISALESRYSKLKSQGYDLSSMFEETANGVRLNRQAVSEFEQALASKKLAETDAHLKTLTNRYKELEDDINNCRNASDRADLYAEQQDVLQKINDLGTLASQYQGLTSAYNSWINTEQSGSERDMYENVISGFKTVKDELSRGWADDGTIKFLEMLTGRTDLAGKSGKELKGIYDSLGKVIPNTTHKIKDFFTTDGSGNSTSKGVYNFLDAIGQLEEEKFGGANVVDRENGKIIGFNFDLAAQKDENGNIIKNGDQVIAEALGISEELVQIMVRAADDAGFVISMDGTYTQFADMKAEADKANDSIKKLAQSNEELKNAGFGEYEFNFGSSSIEDIDKDLEKAKELLNSDAFKDKDGNFDENATGAKDALKIAETLQVAKSKLEEPAYMSINTADLQKDLQEPVKQLQKFEKLTQERDLLNLTGTDKERLSEIDTELNNVAQSLSELPEETKVDLGIDGMTPEQIREQLESGTIEVPAELTIEANMDKNIEDLVTIGLLQSGLITEQEAKIRLGIIVEADEPDTSDAQETIDNAVNEVSENAEGGTTTVEQNVELETGEVKTDGFFSKLWGNIKTLFTGGTVGIGDTGDGVSIGSDGQLKYRVGVKPEPEVNTEGVGEKVKEETKGAIESQSGETTTIEQNANVELKAGTIDDSNLNGEIQELVKNDGSKITVTASVSGKEDVDALKAVIDAINGESFTVTINTTITGKEDVDALKKLIDNLNGKSIQTTINTIVNGEEKAVELKNAVSELDGKVVAVTVNASVTGKEDVNSIVESLNGVSAEVSVTATPVETDLGDGFTGRGKATMEPDITDFGDIFTGTGTAFMQPDRTDFGHIFTGRGTVVMSYSLAGVGAGGGGLATGVTSGLGGSSGAGTLVNGTAHANGTAFANGTTESGRAFKLGDWRTRDSGVALMGELGRELIVRDGRFFTVGDTGAGFYPYKKGDIIFNHRQTEELFKNGHVISNGGRGRTFASGTAFSKGSGGGFWNTNTGYKSESYGSKTSGVSGNAPVDDENKKENEILDWIEKLLERFDRAIDSLDKAANNIYKSFDKRNTSLSDEITKVNEQIANQKKAYDRYIAEANTLGDDIGYKIGSDYEEKIRNGDFSIDVLGDEKLVEYIEAYEEWYLNNAHIFRDEYVNLV